MEEIKLLEMKQKMFLNKDYISAKNKIDQFLNQYPNHSRSLRAKKLLKKLMREFQDNYIKRQIN